MKTHVIEKDEDGDLTLFGELIVIRYDEGDCDTFTADNPNMNDLSRALFDMRECDDRISYEDNFSLNGEIFSL